MNTSNFFFCYDRNLAQFLSKKKSIKYLCHAIHPKTRNHFYLFENNTELDGAIEEWRMMTK